MDPASILVFATLLAIAAGGLLRPVDVPYIGFGLPMVILFVGAGYYVFVTQGITGILENWATGIFIGAVTSVLNEVVRQEQQ